MNFKLFKNVSVGVYEIKLTTSITTDVAAQISNEIDELNKWDATEIIFKINSPGGSILDGYTIATSIRDSKAKIITINEGLAASMAGILLVNGHERQMWDFARLMVHDPSIGGRSLEEMPEGKQKTALLNFKNSLVTLISRNSNLSPAKVSELMTNETWITAKQAKDWGLIGKILKLPQRAPNNITENKLESKEDIQEYLTACSNFLDNSNNNQKRNEMDNEKVISLKEDAFKNEAKIKSLEDVLKLKESGLLKVQDELKEANDGKVSLEEQLKKSSDSVIALKEKLAIVDKEKAILYVENLIDKKVFEEKDKDKLVENAVNDLEGLKSIVLLIPERKSLNASDLINNKKEGSDGRKDWDYEKWDKEDKEGLQKIEKENPLLFNEICNK